MLGNFSFPASILLNFIGEFECRCFEFGSLGGGLPNLVRSVGSRLDWFLGRHDMQKVRKEVVADESMKMWL